MNNTDSNVVQIEDTMVKFIESLAKSAIKRLDNMKPAVKVAFMVEVLKTLHNKDN